MIHYPAIVIATDDQKTVVRFESNGHQIAFAHEAHNAVPVELRRVGAKGFVSFPKVPPVFTSEAA